MHDYHGHGTYTPLQHLADDQAPVEICNSPLSEAGVLGFDYGFSLEYPDGLVIWEAQFGDFVNAAQVIIDQFIASAEVKWRRKWSAGPSSFCGENCRRQADSAEVAAVAGVADSGMS